MPRRFHRMSFAIALVSALAAAPALAADFAADFTWDGTGKCFEPKSPPFKISNAPEGTKTLRFNLVDLDFTSFAHGGGTVAYDGGGTVAQGAFIYRGPCPPVGQHHYEWTVEALDSGGKVLATAKVMKEFPPK